MTIIAHEALYVKKLESIHELFIKPLEMASPPIIPEDQLPGFFLATVDGYTEIFLAHLDLLRCLFTVQLAEHPFINPIHIFEPVLECLTTLQDIYAVYNLDFANRQYVLKAIMEENTQFSTFITKYLGCASPDLVPLKADDVSDVSARYFLLFSEYLSLYTSTFRRSGPPEATAPEAADQLKDFVMSHTTAKVQRPSLTKRDF